MLSAIFFMNSKGDVVISRVYRDDVNRSAAQAFRHYILDTKEIRSPIKSIGDAQFFHVRIDNLYLVAIAHQNVNAAMIFELLYAIIDVFKAYFTDITELNIQNNFVLIYEILDEILDFGYPQNCSKEVLSNLIQLGKAKVTDKNKERLSKITTQATGAIPWRDPKTKHRKNQIFIDVIESVNLIMSSKGTIMNADVSGQIILKVNLSGMPECTIGMNDKALMLAAESRRGRGTSSSARANNIAIEDFSFHQCVSLAKFDSDRVISFIPPEGEFQLMKYRATDSVSLPFKVLHNIKELGTSHSRYDFRVAIRSVFRMDLLANDVKVVIPVPHNTATVKVNVTAGRAKYVPEHNAILWKIRRFPGQTEYNLAAEVECVRTYSSEKKAWSRPPISMDFSVPMYTSSGLQIKYLKVVEKSHYETIKWVRYLTKAGSYQYRI